MSEPAVSVIIATRNRAEMLKDAITSVQAQSFQGWELIIVDDASTDQTKRVVQRIARDDARIRYVRHERQGGVSKARNAGIADATGRYIAFLDDDDQYVPDKLAAQVVHLDRCPQVGFIYGQNEWVDRHGKSLGVQPQQGITTLRELVEHCAIPLQTVMVRRELLSQVGGFNERLSIGEDYDLWLRLARVTAFEFTPRVLVRYRVHGANTCNDSLKLYTQRGIVLQRVPVDTGKGVTWWFKRQRLAVNEYRLARLYREKPDVGQAALHFAKAVAYDPLVGLRMAEPPAVGLQRVIVALKPYAAAITLGFRSLRTSEKLGTFLIF